MINLLLFYFFQCKINVCLLYICKLVLNVNVETETSIPRNNQLKVFGIFISRNLFYMNTYLFFVVVDVVLPLSLSFLTSVVVCI